MLTKRFHLARAIVALVTVALCATLLSSCGFSSKKTIYADFPTAAGLFVGNDVGVLGVPIGKVTAVTPEGNYVKVTMQIDSDQPVPTGAFATVISRSVATDRYVELGPVYKNGDQQIADGATVGTLDTNKVPVEFDQVLTTIGKFADQISGGGTPADCSKVPVPPTCAINRFLSATSTALAGRGALINQAITSLGAAVNGVSQQRGNATSTLDALDGLTAKLAANKETIKAFVQQVSRASALLANERNNFRDAISSATKMINVVAQFAKDNRSQIRLAVNQTNDVLRTVNSKSSQVSEILRMLPLATQNLQRAIDKNQRLVVRLDISALVPVLGPLVGALCNSTAVSQHSLCQTLGLGSLSNPLGAVKNILGGL